MALTPAEKQRRYRERQKERTSQASRTADIYKTPFFEYVLNDWHEFELPLALAGIYAPEFQDDTGPEIHAFKEAFELLDGGFTGAKGSLGRAEVVVGCLLEAARGLARIVNSYKLEEIDMRLAEIAERELSSAAEKKAAFDEVAKLKKMRMDLEKQVRFTMRAWETSA